MPIRRGEMGDQRPVRGLDMRRHVRLDKDVGGTGVGVHCVVSMVLGDAGDVMHMLPRLLQVRCNRCLRLLYVRRQGILRSLDVGTGDLNPPHGDERKGTPIIDLNRYKMKKKRNFGQNNWEINKN